MAIYYFLSVNGAHLRTEGELIIIIIIKFKGGKECSNMI